MSTQVNLATLKAILASDKRIAFLTDDHFEPLRLKFLECAETSAHLEAEILDHDAAADDGPDPLDELLGELSAAIVQEPQLEDDPEPAAETFGERMARLKREKKQRQASAKPATKPAPSAAAAPAAAPKTFSYRATRHKPKTAGNVVSGKAKSPTVHEIGIEQIDDNGTVINRIMLGRVQARLIVEIARNPEQLAALDQLAAPQR
jgi:hypothetical protein